MTNLNFAMELSSAILKSCFWTPPSKVREGSEMAARQPGGGDGGNPSAGRKLAGRVGAKSGEPGMGEQAASTSALRHERSSSTMTSTSLPQWNTRNKGGPAQAGSLGRFASAKGIYSRKGW